MKKTALIMAGGRGERFWPKSRKNLPKQFLSLTNDGRTMIQLTIDRILPRVNIEDIFISTNEQYKSLVEDQLPNLPKENILYEPVGRNTAPCIGLAAAYMLKKYDDAVMYVFPSDHLIKNDVFFLGALDETAKIAECGKNLVTIGITPSYPETGYGYIKFNPGDTLSAGFSVDSFVEKPNIEAAREYISTGQYLWNSGMFAWKLSTIKENIKIYLPSLSEGLDIISRSIGLENEKEIIHKEFTKFESISIDYGILEKAKNIYTFPGSFGWDDVGSWNAIDRIQPSDDLGNIISGETVLVDTKNTIIQGGSKLIAAIGLEDIIIVDTDDAILVCDKNDAGNVKKVLEQLRKNNKQEYL